MLTLAMSAASTQAHMVHLPTDYTCDGCSMRILRQAAEWGRNYIFWSCADVNIEPGEDLTELTYCKAVKL